MTIQIRPLKFMDHFSLLTIYSNPQVTLPAGMQPIQSQQQMDELTKELITNQYYVITLDKKIIGTIGCDTLNPGIGMLGFLLDQKFWHQGYGTKALNLYLSQAKKNGFHTLYADCFLNNQASKKILKKANFTYLQDFEREFPGFNQPMRCHLYMKQL